jgi:hypothetical protein
MYRSDVLVCFGEPIRLSAYLGNYEQRRKEAINALTDEIERRIQTLILYLPRLEHERIISGVKRLYSDSLRIGHQIAEHPQLRAEELASAQRIVNAVESVYETDPQRAAAFAAKLDMYERWLARLRLSEDDLADFTSKRQYFVRTLGRSLVAFIGAPIALYGWIHRLIPFLVVKFAASKLAQPGREKAQASTAAILSGIVAFATFYGLCILVFYWLFGWPATLWYALSLPVASLLAHYYLRESRLWIRSLRNLLILLRAPSAAKRLLSWRSQLISEIEAVHTSIKSK